MPAPKEKSQSKTQSVAANTPLDTPKDFTQPVRHAQDPKQSAPTTSATTNAAVTTPRTPTREEVELAAYALFLERGASDGYAVDDWLQAERELIEGAEAQRKAHAKGA